MKMEDAVNEHVLETLDVESNISVGELTAGLGKTGNKSTGSDCVPIER